MHAALRSFVAVSGLVLAAAASVAAELPFNKAAFDKALAEGKPVVVDFAASWCPTCKQQKPIVQGLLKDARRKPLTLFVADFDKEEALKKQLNVTMQSTLVAFKGGKEVARSTGQTDKAELGALLDKAL
jgi:thiol-disulfide isomerase/thioredoxin